MMEKINVAELLKDCPKGMELDCTIYENVVFHDIVDRHYPIRVRREQGGLIELTADGCIKDKIDAKCVIFPKGKTTWEGFHRPFKDGDIVFVNDEYSDATFTYVAILKRIENNDSVFVHCFYNYDDDVFSTHEYLCDGYNTRFATEEEKAELFKVIKDNGYKWNSETKTLEKLPKFKVGDRITLKNYNDGKPIYKIIDVKDTYYVTDQGKLPFYYADSYELVPDKFDINTLVPFESRVLVRDNIDEKWQPAVWGYYDANTSYPYKTIGCLSRCCIPYEGNQHLLGTTDDCDKYFKTWE